MLQTNDRVQCYLNFDVRMGTVNRGGQTRWRTVPVPSNGQPFIAVTGCGHEFTGDASFGGGGVVVV